MKRVATLVLAVPPSPDQFSPTNPGETSTITNNRSQSPWFCPRPTRQPVQTVWLRREAWRKSKLTTVSTLVTVSGHSTTSLPRAVDTERTYNFSYITRGDRNKVQTRTLAQKRRLWLQRTVCPIYNYMINASMCISSTIPYHWYTDRMRAAASSSERYCWRKWSF